MEQENNQKAIIVSRDEYTNIYVNQKPIELMYYGKPRMFFPQGIINEPEENISLPLISFDYPGVLFIAKMR